MDANQSSEKIYMNKSILSGLKHAGQVFSI